MLWFYIRVLPKQTRKVMQLHLQSGSSSLFLNIQRLSVHTGCIHLKIYFCLLLLAKFRNLIFVKYVKHAANLTEIKRTTTN